MAEGRTMWTVCRVACTAITIATALIGSSSSALAQPAEGLRGVFNEVGKTPRKPPAQSNPPVIKAPEILPPSQPQKPSANNIAAQNPPQINAPQFKPPELKPPAIDGSHSQVNAPSLNLPQVNTGSWAPSGSIPGQGSTNPGLTSSLGSLGPHNMPEIFPDPPRFDQPNGSIDGIFPGFVGGVLGGGGLGAGGLGGLAGGLGGGLLGGLNPGQLGQLGMLSGLFGQLGQGLFSGLNPGMIAQIGIGAGMLLAQSGQNGQNVENQAAAQKPPTPTPTPVPK